MSKRKLKLIDLYPGLGGFYKLGHKCVFGSELYPKNSEINVYLDKKQLT